MFFLVAMSYLDEAETLNSCFLFESWLLKLSSEGGKFSVEKMFGTNSII